MSKLDFVPFIPEHLEAIELREEEKGFWGADPVERLRLLAQTGIAITAFVDGSPLAIFGYNELWKGVYNVWSISSTRVPKYAIMFSKAIKIVINLLYQSQPDIHRVQSYAVHDKRHTRWMKSIGFELEGVAKKLGSDKRDYAMWAMTDGPI